MKYLTICFFDWQRLQKELNETIINLQKDGTNALEKILSDKTGLESTLKTALEKEGLYGILTKFALNFNKFDILFYIFLTRIKKS